LSQLLQRAAKAVVPPFNPHVKEGVVYTHLKHAMSHIDMIWRCAAEDWPESVKYLRMERCTPEEHFNFVSGKRHGKHQLEMAPTDVFLTKVYLSYQGRQLEPRYLYLPFTDQAGRIRLRGPEHTIHPVLADITISVTKNGIYMPFSRSKLTYERLSHSFQQNGKPATGYAVWSGVHSYAEKESGKNVMYTTLTHYLFCKFGVIGTFKRIFGETCNVQLFGPERKLSDFPESDWVICTSLGVAPKTIRGVARKMYRPSKVRLAIPREFWNEFSCNLIAGFFYVVDNYPERLLPQYCDHVRVWTTILGLIIFKNDSREGKVYENTLVHLDSTDSYVDAVVREELAEAGIYCNDTYEFFAYVIQNISMWIMTTNPGTMHGKRLRVLRYVLSDIVQAIFKFSFRIKNDNRRQLNERRLTMAISKYIKPELIFNLSRGHGEVSVVSSPGDNMAYKFTGALVLQSDATGGRSRSKVSLTDPARALHSSIASVGSYPNQPKSDPTGRGKLNLAANVQADGTVLPNPEFQPLLDRAQEIFER